MTLVPIKGTGRGLIPRRSFTTKIHEAHTWPAPIKGLNYMTALSQMDPQSALIASNVLVRNYGLEFRGGWDRWASLIPGEVRTLMPYNPPRGLGVSATSKLFACCSDGKIYDVTAQTIETVVPPVSVTIPGQLEPGEFSWVNYATVTNNFLCCCSAGGGYWTFDSTGGWIDRTTAISGPGSAAAIDFDFVMSWKNRLMFIKNLTCDVYILGVNSIIGASTNFDFGPLLVHGGDLKAMASWTVDGGDGIDDKLVLAGSQGDLLIYEGTDVTAADKFSIIGRWFVGSVPNGRRFMERYGGDLGIVTQFGFVFMSQLLQQRGMMADEQARASYKVNPILADFVRNTLLEQYWEVRYIPSLEALFINSPDGTLRKDRQFVMDVNSKGWSTFDGVPMLTCENFAGALYFGTVDGKVGRAFLETMTTDGKLTTGVLGADIAIEVQTAFIPNGDPVRIKRLLHAAAVFQGIDKPSVQAQINPDWSFQSTPGSPIFLGPANALWDVAIWDQANWGGGAQITYRGWFGAQGVGYYGSLYFKATGLPKTYFVNWTLVSEAGGLM